MKKYFIFFYFLAAFQIMGIDMGLAEEKAYDFIIRDALVYDGESTRAIKADVGITQEYIAAIGDLTGVNAGEVIDAKGLALAPGFIDAHTHSDFNPIVYPGLQNKLAQGVTTQVVGNCGMSAAPVIGTHGERIKSIWAREGVVISKPIEWTTFEEYRNALEAAGMDTNFVGLVGHGNLRSAVMGFTPSPASPSQIEEMKKLLADAMSQGAYGISFGLVYLPGIFAKEEELIELCREAAKHQGVCTFHMRSEGAALLESIQEVIRIAERSQATIQISHLKAGGKKNWGKIQEAFKLIEDARLRGLRIEADVYPYIAGAAELGVVLPDSLYQREDRVAYFQNIFKREELLRELRDYFEAKSMNWNSVMIASSRDPHYQPYEGKTIKQIARETGKEPEKFLIDILADTAFETSAFYFSQSEEVVDQVIHHPYVTIGSDSIADGSRRPHPRAYGTFPRIFKQYVKKEKALQLGEAVRKMTSLAANHFGIEGRGYVRSGYVADLVLFDPDKMKDKATYESPAQLGEGVRWVFLNGKPVVRDGKVVDTKAGRFLVREG